MTAAASTPDSGPDVVVERRAWWALSVSTLVTFLIVIDITAVNVAFPSIADDFGATRGQLSWIVSGYSVTVGALLLAAGRLADSRGRRRMFIPGVSIFALGSALSGLAPSVGLLIGARIIQAIGGAVTTSSSMAVVLPEFPPSRRSTAVGFMGATGALGAVTGPIVGSLLIDVSSWRGIFLVNVPICVLVVFLAPRLLRESRDPSATGRIDVTGVVVGTTGVALMMFGVVQSEEWGFGDPRVAAFVVAGLLLLPILIRRSRHHPEPLINLELFGYRSFASTNLSVVFYGLAFTAGALVSSLALQDLWGQPIRTVGLALAPGPVLAAVVSPLSGRVADRFGHRWVLGGGSLLLALAYAALALTIDETVRLWTWFVPLGLVMGVGIGLTVATWTSAGLSDVPPAKFGVAGATFNTVRQMAYSLGISIVISLTALGDGDLDPFGYRVAWWFVAGSFAVCAAVVVMTFPAGSSHDRGTVE